MYIYEAQGETSSTHGGEDLGPGVIQVRESQEVEAEESQGVFDETQLEEARPGEIKGEQGK